jgi:glycine betaine/choline ABC-type transport system substrate-binding protein
MPSFKDNVKFLNSFIVRAPEANKNKIQTIADLYEQKKIVNFKTALKYNNVISIYP